MEVLWEAAHARGWYSQLTRQGPDQILMMPLLPAGWHGFPYVWFLFCGFVVVVLDGKDFSCLQRSLVNGFFLTLVQLFYCIRA
jgi:hypothetical protein